MPPLKPIVENILKDQLDSSYFGLLDPQKQTGSKRIPQYNNLYSSLWFLFILIILWVIVLIRFSLTSLLPLELFAVIVITILFMALQLSRRKQQS
jgi:hypothetical protein